MTSTRPRPRLRALRAERGWTQQEVAEQVSRLAWLRRHEHVGVNADMVGKWERGQKRASPRYRELLCVLFETDAHGLGFGGPAPAGASVRNELDGNSLIEMLGGAASLVDQLGAAGLILQPRMFDVWKDELMRRRAVLKLMGLATTAGVVPGMGRELARSGTVTPEEMRDLDHLAGRYQALYHSTAPAVLMTPVVAHLETLRDFLRQGVPVSLRRPLFANQARVAMLGGRLAFYDLNDSLAGRGYFNLALESAREAGDHLQAAAAIGQVAHIPAAEANYSAALDYVRAARHQAGKHPNALVESWLMAEESFIHTSAGSHAAALRANDRAREKLAGPSSTADPPWLDYHDETRLSGIAGYALLRDRQIEASRAALSDVVARLPARAVKIRGQRLVELALVDLAGGDLDRA